MNTVDATSVGRWAAARAVARNPLLARALRGLFAFSITEQGCWLAVLLFAFERGGVSEAGLLFVFLLIPSAVLAPVLAVASDVFPRDRVLTAGYGLLALFSILTGTAMVLDAPTVLVWAPALVFAVLLTFAGPATAAIIPIAVSTPDELTAANTAVGMVETAGRLLGPLLAGAILLTATPGAVMIWIGALMGVGALATIGRGPGSTGTESRHADDPDRRSAVIELSAGLRVLRHDPQVRSLVGAVATNSWIAGALDVGAALLAIDVLHRDDAAVSILITGFGAGGLLGSAISFALVGRRRLARALAASVLLMCITFGVVGSSEQLVTATLLLVLVGTGVTLTSVTGRTMLQGLTPDDTLARLFGVLEGLKMVGLAAGGVSLSVV
ncbi:MFS transporter, partial [Ilumatobacter sp.]|uniref:MFS transporter n=1 Tax=Ilumatobacter sp. TaxID=1967498 RepID=UPI003C484E51